MRCPPVILLPLHSLLILLTISGLPTSGSPALSSLSSSSSSGNKGSHKRQEGKAAPQLLVISLDGFRYDYYDHVYLKSLRSLASSGVRARNGIKGVFSTQTFPSHWTIANGLFEESHAIIGNTFFDPVTNDTFTKRSNERHWFGGEPIWVTAKKAGKSVGIFFWIGSTVDYGKHNPDHSLPYNESVPLRERVDTVIKWLAEENLDLALMYWHQPDSAGHAYGALSNEVIKELEHIDVELERMLGLMRENEILNNTNIIVLADHGMMNRTNNHETSGIIEIPIYDPEISQSVDRIVEGAVVTHFWTKAGQESEDRLIDHLRRLDDQTGGHFSVYLKEELPSRWHYGDNARVAPVVAVADPGFQFLLLKVSPFFSVATIFSPSSVSSSSSDPDDGRLCISDSFSCFPFLDRLFASLLQEV